MIKVGNYITTYDEHQISYSIEKNEKIRAKVKERVQKRYEQILKKGKNYAKYFYNLLYTQMIDSDNDELIYYGFFLSKMRLEVNFEMDAAAAVGFDFYTKMKVTAESLGISPETLKKIVNGEITHDSISKEDAEKILKGTFERALNTEEYFIIFNPIEMALFTREERIAIVKHEINHMLRLHHLRFFDDSFRRKTKKEIDLENIVLDKEINGTFDNPYILELPGTKGHVPHVYPAVVKETFFLPAYKQGLITERQFEKILSEEVSAETMFNLLKQIQEKEPNFIDNALNQSCQLGQEQGNQGNGDIDTSSLGMDEDDLEDIEDENLSEEEMRKRIEEFKQKIKELDELLKEGQKNQQQEGQKSQQQQSHQSQQQINNQTHTQSQSNNGQQSQNQQSNQSGKHSQISNGQSNSSNQQNQKTGNQNQSLKEEYDKVVSELAEKLAEAYVRGLLGKDGRGFDSHDEFVRDVPKGVDLEGAKKKTLETLKDLIKRTQEEFDFERPKSRGFQPSLFEKAYDNIVNMLKPQHNYKELLKKIIKNTEGFKSRRKPTWETRSIIAPFDPNIKGKKKAKKPPIALIIDTSGSMSDAEVISAFGELIGMIQAEAKNGGVGIRVVQIDTQITMDEFLENPRKKDISKLLKRRGGGGTEIEPAIKRVLGIGESEIELPNGQKMVVSNKKLLAKKSGGVRPRTIFVVTDGYIENEFQEIVPFGFEKTKNQFWLPKDVEIVWLVTGDFSKNKELAKKEAEGQLSFNYKKYGKQMHVVAIDKSIVIQQINKKGIERDF